MWRLNYLPCSTNLACLPASQRPILLLAVFPFSIPNLTVAEPFQGWTPLTRH